MATADGEFYRDKQDERDGQDFLMGDFWIPAFAGMTVWCGNDGVVGRMTVAGRMVAPRIKCGADSNPLPPGERGFSQAMPGGMEIGKGTLG